MKRRFASMLMAVIMLCSMFYMGRMAAVYTMADRTSEKKRCVVIDAGHGETYNSKIKGLILLRIGIP